MSATHFFTRVFGGINPRAYRASFTALVVVIASAMVIVGPAPATASPIVPAYVQGASIYDVSSASSVSKSFVSANTAGNLIVASATWDDNGTYTMTCSDTQGNTYVNVVSVYRAGNTQSMGTCYAANVNAGANTVTVTFSGSRTYRGVMISEYSGVATSNPVDIYSANQGVGAGVTDDVTSNAATTVSSGDLIYGAFWVADPVAGAGFTQRLTDSNRLLSEDTVQSSAGSISATASSSVSGYVANMVAFRSIQGYETAQVSVAIDPSFTFTVGALASACNGESGFLNVGTSSSVPLAHLAAGASASGGQSLTAAGNAGGGFAIYVRGTQSSQNLRSAGHNWTDVAGSYASPAVLGPGERFGYTYKDSTSSSSVTNPGSALFAALDATNRAVAGSATSKSGSACISYTAQASASTPAASYSAVIVYTAVPTF